jgi:hypothetical protein
MPSTNIVEVSCVKLHIGCSEKRKGRPLSVMSHLKKSVVVVTAAENSLAHALVIAKARLTDDPEYKAYRQGRKIRTVVEELLRATGIDLTDGGGIPELQRFQEYFKEFRIVVYSGLECEDVVFAGQVQSEKRLNLLYDAANRHYNIITNITGAMAQRHVCKGCDKGGNLTHKCDAVCSDCLSVPPCAFDENSIPCPSCNGRFRSRASFDRHKTNTMRGKTVCERKNCGTCGAIVTRKNHECFKAFCKRCSAHREVGHLCYMTPLKNVLLGSDDVLLVFYDFETTQDTRLTSEATLHVPNLVYVWIVRECMV